MDEPDLNFCSDDEQLHVDRNTLSSTDATPW